MAKFRIWACTNKVAEAICCTTSVDVVGGKTLKEGAKQLIRALAKKGISLNLEVES